MFRKCLIVVVVLSAGSMAAAQQFSDWATTVPTTNLGAPVNSQHTETDPFISKDGLSLYFACADCPEGGGIYVAQRASFTDSWGTPDLVVPNGLRPVFSPDEHRLYFSSSQLGGYGYEDIFVVRRHDKHNDFGWGAPENLGPGVNSSANESTGSIFENEVTGATIFYFDSDRLGTWDIFASPLQADESFGEATLVEELSLPADDNGRAIDDRRPMVRRDGLEIFLLSNREGSLLNLKGLPSVDLWSSTRASTAEPWPSPVNVDPDGAKYINTRRHDGGPALSFDGTTLYFHAAQRVENLGANCEDPGKSAFASCFFDIWVTTREKLTGPAN